MEKIDTNTTTNLPVVQMREMLPELLKSSIPWMEEKHVAAMTLLDSIEKPTTDEEAEDVEAKLAAIREVGSALEKKRKQMTEITDAFKQTVMEFERPFDSKSDKSKYSEKRKLLVAYQQEKLEKRREEERQIAKRKEVDNFKVDLKARIQRALSDNVTSTIKASDDYARALFKRLTLQNFDEETEKFKKQKPKLKVETYNKCFEVPNDMIAKAESLLQPGEFTEFTVELQKEESYDKWNTAIQEAVAPVLNEWRARIPNIKEEMIRVSKADEEQKEKMLADQAKREEEDRVKREQEIEQKRKEQEAKIQEEANLSKMSNEFAAQAVSQGLDDAGGVKLVAKFTDPKLTPKALMNIIYHCFAHPDFPGIQKRDKSKKLVFDDKQRPEYIDAVQYWIDFFLKNCDADVEGLQIFEDAKIVIRK